MPKKAGLFLTSFLERLKSGTRYSSEFLLLFGSDLVISSTNSFMVGESHSFDSGRLAYSTFRCTLSLFPLSFKPHFERGDRMADISAKLQSLLRELSENRARELRLARWSHWFNVSAMFTTLLTTGIAVVYGLMPNHSSQITAGLALLPGGIALLATSLKLQARCDWHYKNTMHWLRLFARSTLSFQTSRRRSR